MDERTERYGGQNGTHYKELQKYDVVQSDDLPVPKETRYKENGEMKIEKSIY